MDLDVGIAQFTQGEHLGPRTGGRMAGQLTIGQQERADISARRQFQSTPFEQIQILVEPGQRGFSGAAVRGLDGFLDLSPAPAEADLEMPRGRMYFEPGHRGCLKEIVRPGPLPGPAIRLQRNPNAAPQKRWRKERGLRPFAVTPYAF